MKKSNLVVIALSMVLATGSQAQWVLNHAKILDSKTTVSPGRKGWFVEGDGSKIKKIALDYSSASAFVNDFEGATGQDVDISSDHSFNVNNTSNNSEIYEYKYSLSLSDGGHIDQTDHIQVDSHGSASNDGSLHLTENDDEAGTYQITAETTVSGASNAHDSSHAYLTVDSNIKV